MPVEHGSRGRPAVVVVNYGSSALLAENLVASTRPGDLVVVVDNRLDDQERRAVRALADRHGWLLETPASNLGFGTGMNVGVARALREGATSLLLLNPDARLDPEGRDRLCAQVEADPSLLLAPRITTSDGAVWMSGVMDLRLADGTTRSARHRAPGAEVMEWVSGAVMAMGVDLWRRTGGFDDEYFLYWEDIDLCRRVHAVGGRVAVDQEVVAVHDEGGTHRRSAGRAKSETFYVHVIRNRTLYARKWLDTDTQRRWARRAPAAAWDTMLTGGRRQFVEGLTPWRALARGLLGAWVVSRRDVDRTALPADDGAGRDESRSARTVRVLESFPEPGPQTNPYIIQLRRALAETPHVQVSCWSWRTALVGRYDVVHAHWPESLVERRGRLSTLGRRLLFGAFLARLRLTSTPVVRTMHNLELPSGLRPVEVRLLRGLDRLTRVGIVLNGFTPVPAGVRAVEIEHGHYRTWFAPFPRSAPVPGRVAFVGKVRRYKNVEGLLRAFTGLGPGPVSLTVAGSPSSSQLADTLRDLAGSDPRTTLRLGYLEDADLVRVVTESEVVVLPYHEMHNSGSVLAALSLARPVLVPDNAFNRALADEVGHDWVLRYEGELTSDTLRRGLERARRIPPGTEPDLGGRDWSTAGSRHAEAFRLATGASAAGRG